MKLIVLDRDGVINEDSPDFIKSPGEWIPIPGSLDAIARLNRAGWTVTVATNQSGLGRGLFNQTTLEAIHQRMLGEVAACGGHIEIIEYCPALPGEDAACRKPRPGMLLEIARRLGASLQDVPMVGDARRDIEAARAVGARPLLVLTGKGRGTLEQLDEAHELEVFPDLAAAVDALLEEPDPPCHR